MVKKKKEKRNELTSDGNKIYLSFYLRDIYIKSQIDNDEDNRDY